MTAELHGPIGALRGVGPRSTQKLFRLGLHTPMELLLHLPVRYENRTEAQPIARVKPGSKCLVEGIIDRVRLRHQGRRSLQAVLRDDTGTLILRFFNFSNALTATLRPSVKIRCFGLVRVQHSIVDMIHPEVQVLESCAALTTETLTPVYPTVAGLSQKVLDKLTSQALNLLVSEEPDKVDKVVRKVLGDPELPTFARALRLLHAPPKELAPEFHRAYSHPAQRRVVFDELLAQRVAVLSTRRWYRSHHAVRVDSQLHDYVKFLEILPFKPTAAQLQAINDIVDDMRLERPMLRLLLGDVGTGKTVVAIASAFAVIAAGAQVAFMAPTEALAQQHFDRHAALLSHFQFQTGLLTGRQTKNRRSTTLDGLIDGSIKLVFGTHALLQEDVKFQRLGMLIVDEQHRFGVQQKLRLRAKGEQMEFMPHQLVMSATPIPRTLALILQADMDLTTLRDPPPDRLPIRTIAVPESRRAEVLEKIAARCQSGQQVYWICTLVSESDSLQCQAAAVTTDQLRMKLPGMSVGLLHGALAPEEKSRTMTAFRNGELEILVATTVVEVGIDVPNASIMVIENAERLGLSQLHQLRGRIGRNGQQSDCVLLYKSPLNKAARERIATIRSINDGFAIAERDLALRGPGETLGTRQAGNLEWRIANPVRDAHLSPLVSRAADVLLESSADCVSLLAKRWGHRSLEVAAA